MEITNIQVQLAKKYDTFISEIKFNVRILLAKHPYVHCLSSVVEYLNNIQQCVYHFHSYTYVYTPQGLEDLI